MNTALQRYQEIRRQKEAAQKVTPERIRALREATGLSLQGLADKVHVTKTTVHLWEVGTYKPGKVTVRRLLRLMRKAGL